MIFCGGYGLDSISAKIQSAEHQAIDVSEKLQDILMSCVHFIGFQCAVGCAVVEAVGNGFAIRGDLLAGWIGEEVKAFVGNKQRLLCIPENRFDFSIRGAEGKLHRRIAG